MNFLGDFIANLRNNNSIGEFDRYETINRANFGVYISKPSKRSGKYEDNITKLIDENVKVISGPFRGYTGNIDEINLERGKAKVLISIFGRETPVELDFLQIKKL